MILRYFDCRGRAQALRDVLIDAGLDFRTLLGAMDQPRLSALLESVETRARDRGCLGPGRRQAPFTGNPREAEMLARLQAAAAQLDVGV